MAQAQNNLPAEITETINNILTEVNEFKEKTNTSNITLTGSTALYLFVYSLYVNNSDPNTKAFVKSQLQKLPNPNDIDIVTTQPKKASNLSNYKNKNNESNEPTPLDFLSEVSGKPIKRKAGSLYSIDLIIKPKALFESINIIIPYDGKNIEITIIHPQELMTNLYPAKSNHSGYNSNSNINEAPLNNVKGMNIKTKKAKKKTEYNIKREVLKAINDYGLIPVLEKQAAKRKRNSGNEGKPSFRSRLNFGSPMNTKKAKSRLSFN